MHLNFFVSITLDFLLFIGALKTVSMEIKFTSYQGTNKSFTFYSSTIKIGSSCNSYDIGTLLVVQTWKIKIRYKHVFIYFCFKNLQNDRKRLSGCMYFITGKSRMSTYQSGCQSDISGWKGLANSWARFSALLWLQSENKAYLHIQEDM
jgi:hypothetical protein